MNWIVTLLWRLLPGPCSWFQNWRWRREVRRRRFGLARSNFLGASTKDARSDDSEHETLEADRMTGGLIRRKRSLEQFLNGEQVLCDHEWEPAIRVLAHTGPYKCVKCRAELDLPPHSRLGR